MQIKILKSSSSFYWYSKHIGEVFTVVKEEHNNREDSITYWVREGGEYNCLNIVLDQDCEVVNWDLE